MSAVYQSIPAIFKDAEDLVAKRSAAARSILTVIGNYDTPANTRSDQLRSARTLMRQVAGQGGFSAIELQDFVCCLIECAGNDQSDAKASLADLQCDLDGLITYGPDEADHE